MEENGGGIGVEGGIWSRDLVEEFGGGIWWREIFGGGVGGGIWWREMVEEFG